ncbi:MAG: hypothetical protein FJW88_07450 [Actinobacteria bacterium]|nr:hypothetical protein [Actinomycetota bacterium]
MKRGWLLGIVAGALVLVLVWYFLLWAPASKDLDDTREQVSEQQRQQLSLEATVKRLQALAENAPQLQATLRRYDAAIPETPDLADFIIQCNDIAIASGIDWLAISPSPPAAGTPVTTIALSINVQGGFFQVLDYLNRLEDLERLVVVDTINIAAGGGTADGSGTTSASSDASGGTLTVTLTGRMFTRGTPPAAPGTESSPTTETTTTTSAGSSTTTTTGSSGATTSTTGVG